MEKQDLSEIIYDALKDDTSFNSMYKKWGLREKQIKNLMKTNLKKKTYLNWRKRVNGRKSKHPLKNNII